MDYKVFNKKHIQDLDGKLLKVTQQTGRRAREGDRSPEAQQNGLASKPHCSPCRQLKGELGWKMSREGTAKVQVSKRSVCTECWKL